jgi:FMN phosphatase YigB (HAD superfamily)
MKTVTHIYFDWSKTLALPKTRDIFISPTSTMDERMAVLYPDTLPTLEYLCERGYTLGIISNTHKRPAHFIRALSKTRLIQYFKGAIALSSDPKLCEKACAKIFQHCLQQDGLLTRPNEAVMIGDSYSKDVVGGLQVGMRAIHVNRDGTGTGSINRNTNPASVVTIRTLGELVNYF